MNAQSIAFVIRQLTGEDVQYSKYLSNLSISCPLAPYTHKNGTDRSRGFTIKVDDLNVSPGYCWSCGFKGNLYQLADELTKQSGVNHKWFKDLVREHETPSLMTLLDYVEEEKPVATKYLEKEYLDSFPYLTESRATYRNLTSETLDELQFRYDKDHNRVLIPLITREGTVGLSGRTTIDAEPKYLNYGKFQKGKYLFNECHLTPGRRMTILLVEGQLDAAWCHQCLKGRDMVALSPMGNSLTKTQTQKLVDNASSVHIFFDNDRSGNTGTFKVIDTLLDLGVDIYVRPYPMSEKDPGEMSKEALLWHIDRMVKVEKKELEHGLINLSAIH